MKKGFQDLIQKIGVFFIAVISILGFAVTNYIIQMAVDVKIMKGRQVVQDGRKILPVGLLVAPPFIKGGIIGILTVTEMGRSNDKIKFMACGITGKLLT